MYTDVILLVVLIALIHDTPSVVASLSQATVSRIRHDMVEIDIAATFCVECHFVYLHLWKPATQPRCQLGDRLHSNMRFVRRCVDDVPENAPTNVRRHQPQLSQVARHGG